MEGTKEQQQAKKEKKDGRDNATKTEKMGEKRGRKGERTVVVGRFTELKVP